MLICMNCKTQLLCTKSSVAAEYPRNQIFQGDLFECPNCKWQILRTREYTTADPDHRLSNSYVNMGVSRTNIDLSGEKK